MHHTSSNTLSRIPAGRPSSDWPKQHPFTALKQHTLRQTSISPRYSHPQPPPQTWCRNLPRAWKYSAGSSTAGINPPTAVTFRVSSNPRQTPPVRSHSHLCPPSWQARASHHPLPASSSTSQPCRRQRPTVQLRWRRGRAGVAAAGETGIAGRMSEGDGEEGDKDVSRELDSFDVERFRRASVHLDLMWNVEKGPKPEQCDCCGGTGHRRCEFCHGTGAMMVGEERFCSLERGCKPCPVCHSTGEVKCLHCNGTGFRASWLEPGCPLDKL